MTRQTLKHMIAEGERWHEQLIAADLAADLWTLRLAAQAVIDSPYVGNFPEATRLREVLFAPSRAGRMVPPDTDEDD